MSIPFFLRAVPLAVVLGCAMSLQAFAGPIDKAFEALEMKDYFKAKQIFEKRLDKERLAATFGMCRVFIEQQNPFFNLDSARVYALRTESLFKTAPKKDRDKVLEYGITAERVDALRRTLYTLALEEVTKANTLSACDLFLTRFPESPDKRVVLELKASLEFAAIRKEQTPELLQAFLAAHPSSKEAVEAKVLLDRAVFDRETADGSVRNYHEFIARHPNSPHRRTAEDRIYALSTANQTMAEFHAFITANPKNPHVADAWRRLFSLHTQDRRRESLVDFKLTYPDYPFMDELNADMDIISRRVYPARKDGKWGFVDRLGKEAVPFRYQQVQAFSDGLAAFQRDGLWGYLDKRGKEIIAPQFDEADGFHDGVAIVGKGEKMGAINAKGDWVVEPAHDELLDFALGLAAFSSDGQFGYVDREGKVVLPPKFDDAWTFSEGLAAVERDDRMGFINTQGDLIVPFRFEEVESFKNGMSRVVLGDLNGLLDMKGNLIVACKYDRIGHFSEGVAPVLLNDKAGFIDITGKEVVAVKLDASKEDLSRMMMKHGRSIARKKKLYGLIDSTGAEVRPFKYEHIDPVREGRYAARLKGRFGFINASGAEVIPFIFEDTKGFSEGRAAVKEKGLWGFINEAGEHVILAQFNSANDFLEGVAIVGKDGHLGLIDENGIMLLPAAMDRIDRTDDPGLLLVEKLGRMAYYDINARSFTWSETGF